MSRIDLAAELARIRQLIREAAAIQAAMKKERARTTRLARTSFALAHQAARSNAHAKVTSLRAYRSGHEAIDKLTAAMLRIEILLKRVDARPPTRRSGSGI